MKKKIVLVSLCAFLVSCGNDVTGVTRSEDINKIDMNYVERLPEEQKDVELNKTLADMRNYRKENVSSENGNSTIFSMNDSQIVGQTKNRPNFANEPTELVYERIEVMNDYVKNIVKVPERKNYGWDIAQCIDPRMNEIYDDEDKGVANGYVNENIFVAEYETSEDNVYSYFVMVREKQGSEWKVIYDGLDYRE